MKHAIHLEHRASSSWSKHEGDPSLGLCDRLDRTRDNSQRQLPTDHDYAVPTREYQTDQSSLKSALVAARSALGQKQKQRQLQKHPHRFCRVDTVTPYQAHALNDLDLSLIERIRTCKRPTFPSSPERTNLASANAARRSSRTPELRTLRPADSPPGRKIWFIVQGDTARRRSLLLRSPLGRGQSKAQVSPHRHPTTPAAPVENRPPRPICRQRSGRSERLGDLSRIQVCGTSTSRRQYSEVPRIPFAGE